MSASQKNPNKTPNSGHNSWVEADGDVCRASCQAPEPPGQEAEDMGLLRSAQQ